jgi:hypothetical protein
MLVKVLSFGTNWWARVGHDPRTPFCITRRSAYYNSTGVRCGRKVRRHWIISGLVRFNGVGDFNPHLPNRSKGHTFHCSDLTVTLGGNRLLFGRKASRSELPDCYLVVVTSEQHGRFDFTAEDWRSGTAAVIAASQLRDVQEAMLLMKPGDWVQTNCGLWQLRLSENERTGVALELIGNRPSA